MRRWGVTAAVIAALLLGGCGGDGDGDDGSAATQTAQTTTTTSTITKSTLTEPRQTRTDRISGCLTQLGYKLTGGAPQQPEDPDVADYQIVLDSPRGGGYIGFYKNASRAARVVKQLRQNATRVSGAGAERHGAINIVWVDLPDQAARRSVRACLVD